MCISGRSSSWPPPSESPRSYRVAKRPLADQFRRAAMSIPLNVAEGSGRSPGSADRARFRGIARGSAMECGAILDVVRLFEIAPEPEWHQAKALLVRVVVMLSKMC